MSHFTSNQTALEEAKRVQEETKKRLDNTQRMLQETDEVADETAQRLAQQTEQIGDITDTVDGSLATLQQVDKNIDTFEKWRGNFFGGKRKAEEHAIITGDDGSLDRDGFREVLENEVWATFKREWVAASEPPVFSSVTGDPLPEYLLTHLPPRDLRSPTYETPLGTWELDFNRQTIDAEGWSYAKDFEHFMDSSKVKSAPDWRCHARQRSWLFSKNENTAMNEEVREIRDRQEERRREGFVNSSNNSSSKNGETVKIDMHGVFGEGGGGIKLSQTGTKGDWRSAINGNTEEGRQLTQEERNGLREISHNDHEMDGQIDMIGNMIDGLGDKARNMNQEVTHQNEMLDNMERKVQDEQDKLSKVTQRVKWNLFKNK